jgi:16S rRNA (cytidine1402-2'-O)-methyltransferase
MHEEYVRGTLGDLRALLGARDAVKGEIVLVVAGAPQEAAPTESPEALFARLTAEGLTRRDAVKEVARRLGLPARDVYKRVLAL